MRLAGGASWSGEPRWPSAGRERAPLRSAPLAPPLLGRPSSRPAVAATSSPDPAAGGRERGRVSGSRSGRGVLPLETCVLPTSSSYSLAPGAAASKKRS